MVRPCSCPTSDKLVRGRPDKEHAMSQKLNSAVAVTLEAYPLMRSHAR